ncbi:MAG: tetratricopeptide repeat protein [Deltaproteobacteria bacterium]|nr:tetratricopeptide repeat protein [Deltaproteobacteria bacterium]
MAAILLYGCAPRLQDKLLVSKSAESRHHGVEEFNNGNYKRSLDRFMEALRIDRSIDDRHSEILDLVDIGRVYIALGQYNEASSFLNEAVRLGIEIKEDRGLAEAYVTLAKAGFMAGNSAAALSHLEESMAIDGRLSVTSAAKVNLKAYIFMDTGRGKEAEELFRKALEIGGTDGNGTEAANSYRGLARLKRQEGKAVEAALHFEDAYRIDKSNGDALKIAADLENMAELKLEDGKSRDALFLFERCYLVSLNGGFALHAAKSLDRMIYIYKEMGNEEKAAFYKGIRDGLLSGDNKAR